MCAVELNTFEYSYPTEQNTITYESSVPQKLWVRTNPNKKGPF